MDRWRIPTSALVPVLREYLDKYETESLGNKRAKDGRPVYKLPPISPIEVLACQAGMPTDSLRKVLNQRALTVGFNVDDRLLCAANKVDAWHKPPLAEFYDPDSAFSRRFWQRNRELAAAGRKVQLNAA